VTASPPPVHKTPFWKDARPSRRQADQNTVSCLQRAAPTLPDHIKAYVSSHFERIEHVIEQAAPGSGQEAGSLTAMAYDGLISTLFLAARAMLQASHPGMRVALAGVGSYGRGSMSVASDLDIRILFEGEEEPVHAVADAILYPLWDVHVPVGHQVVRGDELLELARTDLRTATTLLDWRHVAGDQSLWRALIGRANEGLFSTEGAARFAATLQRDSEARHERFGGSVYLLEPDVKLGPGGMRDLDVVSWVARARWKVDRVEDLVRLGVLVPREAAEFVQSREHLWRVRNLLHLHAARRSDRLTFDEQERLAEVLGFGSGTEAVEHFMSTHYKHASAISRAREHLCERAADIPRSRRPLEKTVAPGLKLFDDQLTFSSTQALVSDPCLALRIYDEAVHGRLPIYAEARKAMRRALQLPSFRQSLFSSAEAQGLFLSLCATVRNTALRRDSVLGDMHDVGLLTAMIPEFIPVVGRVHHDAYHVLTVDIHSIAAVDRLRALARGDLLSDYPLACRIAAETSRPHVLFLATLLHDIGKAIGRQQHSIRGAEAARDIALRFGMSGQLAVEVSSLVREHLTLYHLATRRDVEDPAVLDEVLRITRGRQRLRDLFLLTFADVSTTNPEAMTAWKAGLLDALFVAAEARLRGDAAPMADAASLARERVAQVCAEATHDPAVCAFIDSMPERYLLGTAPERILQHARVVLARSPGAPSVAVLSTDSGASAELCVVADDRPGLLAAIAAALAANRLAVLEAQIYSRTRPDGQREAVDLFFVRAAGDIGDTEFHRTANKVQRDLVDVLAASVSADELVRPRIAAFRSERRSPPVRTEVAIDNRASAGLTVVEVFTRDRPALLYLLARAFRDLELSIQIAKINTEGTRVADVFYVSEATGSKLETVERVEQVRQGILASIAHFASEGS
jgi:[protein-PII] uridylyltransferase